MNHTKLAVIVRPYHYIAVHGIMAVNELVPSLVESSRLRLAINSIYFWQVFWGIVDDYPHSCLSDI